MKIFKITVVLIVGTLNWVLAGVNPQTGNFSFSVTDYQNTCHQMTVSIQRTYNSFYRQSGPFGQSWLANFQRQIVPLSSMSLELIEADGYISTFYLKSLVDNKTQSIEQILKEKKKSDIAYTGNPKGKSLQHYESLKEKMLMDQDYFLSLLQRYIPVDSQQKQSLYTSNDRRSSTLIQSKDGFTRNFLNGDTQEYNRDGQLILEKDSHGTFIRYIYRNNALKTIRDSCGQYITLEYDRKDRITDIQDHQGKTVSYIYDDLKIKNTLKRFTGIDKLSLEFDYDPLFRITKILFPDQKKVELLYDLNTGKISSHIGPGPAKALYTYKSTRGIDQTIVKDERQKKYIYEFIPAQNKSTYTDPDGHEQIKTMLSCCGKLSSVTDRKGQGEFYTYSKDKQKLIEKKSSSQPSVYYTYNDLNLVSDIRQDKDTIHIEYSQHGQPITISKNKQALINAAYDRHGNLIRIYDKTQDLQILRQQNGDVRKMTLTLPNRSLSMDIHYSPQGNIAQKVFSPNAADTQQSISYAFKQMLDLLKLKSYLPNL